MLPSSRWQAVPATVGPATANTHAHLNTRPRCQENQLLFGDFSENEVIILCFYQPLLFTRKQQHNMSLALLMMPLYDSNYEY